MVLSYVEYNLFGGWQIKKSLYPHNIEQKIARHKTWSNCDQLHSIKVHNIDWSLRFDGFRPGDFFTKSIKMESEFHQNHRFALQEGVTS